MNTNKNTPLVDQYLESIENIKEAETDTFFYTRLKARMEGPQDVWGFSLKPALLIVMLTIMLLVNSFIIIDQQSGNNTNATDELPGSSSVTLSNY